MKNKTIEGLGNKNLLPFPKHHSFKYWRLKSNVNSHISIQCVSQSESLSWTFVRRQMVSPKKVHVQTTWNFRLQKIAHAVIKLMLQKGERTCVTTDWYPFVKFLAKGGYLFLNWYLRLGKIIFDFIIWISKVCARENISLGSPSAINNDRSLSLYKSLNILKELKFIFKHEIFLFKKEVRNNNYYN